MAITILSLALFLIAFCNAKAAEAASEQKNQSAACLACHGGSFDKLATKPASFKTATGELINPHVYVPHDKKEAQNIPNCLDCHSKHSLPPTEKIDLTKVTVNSCFLACHHTEAFQRCDTCHEH